MAFNQIHISAYNMCIGFSGKQVENRENKSSKIKQSNSKIDCTCVINTRRYPDVIHYANVKISPFSTDYRYKLSFYNRKSRINLT